MNNPPVRELHRRRRRPYSLAIFPLAAFISSAAAAAAFVSPIFSRNDSGGRGIIGTPTPSGQHGTAVASSLRNTGGVVTTAVDIKGRSGTAIRSTLDESTAKEVADNIPPKDVVEAIRTTTTTTIRADEKIKQEPVAVEDNDDPSFTQFNVANNLESATSALLSNLDTSSSTYPSRNKSYASFARLSRAHHSLMAKTSNMRRQRFVTGKYPLYVSVEQNPTRKWLGRAESAIYLNGTSIDKSLASYDIFHWLDDEEREELHGDYEFLSVELLAEIHMKKPGYVNILPGGGAGASLLRESRDEEDEGVLGRWKSWKLREALDSQKNDNNPQSDEVKSEGERLWVTGFSLTKQRGELHTMDVESGVISNVNDRTARSIKWPNEVSSVPKQTYLPSNGTYARKEDALEDALLVTDGFLVPGKDKGGLYVVRNPGNDLSEWRVCLTSVTNLKGDTMRTAGSEGGDWFYHRAVWMDLTGDGRLSVMAARAKLPLLPEGDKGVPQQEGGGKTPGKGQLVWLERPKPHSFDPETGTPLDVDGTVFDPFNARNTPWKLRVLADGPDVMFSVADLDPADDTIEVIASQFFGEKLSLHSLQRGPEPKIVFSRTIDDQCGAAFSSVLADLDGLTTMERSRDQPMVVDGGSTHISLNEGDAFSHLLVTSHECSYAESSGDAKTSKSSQRQEVRIKNSKDNPDAMKEVYDYEECKLEDPDCKIDGGSLFAYRIPTGKDAWRTEPWPRSIIATGFKVQGQLSNMINPGAPGFCYPFFPTREGGLRGTNGDKKWRRPLICLSGDCAESAYILRPTEHSDNGMSEEGVDKSTKYALMCEIQCKSTVGSLAIGYDDLYSAEQQSGYAKIYVPCYEQDKVLVFAMGS
eukprot:CAMPEP_0183715222 /NCGR_PEP_ID=MMETSP0737-20130205/9543_1 /TAXON_ID=385413 /ORGANISM="Thalassiosira miniscula, Strain CCMP1093" /LENGTH=868 /DNA_ID=CAMNT_0025944311 /DNA_START=383 /DNA_END=2986 /DNA_ORIENTATION=-